MGDASKTPERIWILAHGPRVPRLWFGPTEMPSWDGDGPRPGTPYVRADIHTAVEQERDALRALLPSLFEFAEGTAPEGLIALARDMAGEVPSHITIGDDDAPR